MHAASTESTWLATITNYYTNLKQQNNIIIITNKILIIAR